MKRVVSTSSRQVVLLTDPDTEWVSIVSNGANQTPLKVKKADAPLSVTSIKPNAMPKSTKTRKRKTKGAAKQTGKTPVRTAMNKGAKKPVKKEGEAAAPNTGVDVHRITFAKKQFATRAEVEAYLNENGYRDYEIKNERNQFVMLGRDIGDFKDGTVEEFPGESEGVSVFSGTLTKDAVSGNAGTKPAVEKPKKKPVADPTKKDAKGKAAKSTKKADEEEDSEEDSEEEDDDSDEEDDDSDEDTEDTEEDSDSDEDDEDEEDSDDEEEDSEDSEDDDTDEDGEDDEEDEEDDSDDDEESEDDDSEEDDEDSDEEDSDEEDDSDDDDAEDDEEEDSDDEDEDDDEDEKPKSKTKKPVKKHGDGSDAGEEDDEETASAFKGRKGRPANKHKMSKGKVPDKTKKAATPVKKEAKPLTFRRAVKKLDYYSTNQSRKTSIAGVMADGEGDMPPGMDDVLFMLRVALRNALSLEGAARNEAIDSLGNEVSTLVKRVAAAFDNAQKSSVKKGEKGGKKTALKKWADDLLADDAGIAASIQKLLVQKGLVSEGTESDTDKVRGLVKKAVAELASETGEIGQVRKENAELKKSLKTLEERLSKLEGTRQRKQALTDADDEDEEDDDEGRERHSKDEEDDEEFDALMRENTTGLRVTRSKTRSRR